jgi:hypothetical protein
MLIKTSTFINIVLSLGFSYFCYLMVLITLQYVPLNYEVSFLQLKDEKIYLHYRIAFFAHVYSSIFVLILGFFQFSIYLRTHFTKIHKIIGYFYISILLFIASPSGLVMGYYGNGGLYSKISFCLQAVLWFWFTFLAFHFARKRKMPQHQYFMALSYALTLSAISLRLFKWIIANIWALPPMDTYKIVVWLGWTFNVLVVVIWWRVKIKIYKNIL